MSTLHSLQQPDLRITKAEQAINGLRSQGASLCGEDLQSFFNNDYRIGVYKNFGQGRYSFELARDLLKFREECRKSKSPNISFWAVFEQSDDLSETEFEAGLWNELSRVASQTGCAETWNPQVSAEADEKSFCFQINDVIFSVVGLHPHSSETPRRFACPTLVFNLDDNLQELAAKGKYTPRVAVTPRRESKFQVSVDSFGMDLFIAEDGDHWAPLKLAGLETPPASNYLSL